MASVTLIDDSRVGGKGVVEKSKLNSRSKGDLESAIRTSTMNEGRKEEADQSGARMDGCLGRENSLRPFLAGRCYRPTWGQFRDGSQCELQ